MGLKYTELHDYEPDPDQSARCRCGIHQSLHDEVVRDRSNDPVSIGHPPSPEAMARIQQIIDAGPSQEETQEVGS